MFKNKVVWLLCAGMLLVQGCGTTSGLRSVDDSVNLDLSAYDRIVVLDFQDQTDKTSLKPDQREMYDERIGIATRTFADLLASEIRDTNAYAEVLREASAEPALAVTGAVTRYQEGKAAMRLFIGMGAGSSYFDADVLFTDNLSQEQLAAVQVDKNSWALGGGLAAGQTVENFMKGAAKEIAKELAAAKMNANDASRAQAGSVQ